jgi:hypothetical protein
MRIRLAALLVLFSVATLALTGCGGSSSSSAPSGPASFLFTMAAPDLLSGVTNSYPAAATGNAVAATGSATLTANYLGYGVRGDGAGKVYALGNLTDGTNILGTLLVNVYSTTNGVLTLTRSFNYAFGSNVLFSFAPDSSGNVYVSLLDGSLLKFAANATGTATPTIVNVGTVLFPMATDSSGNLYGYAGDGVIGVFPAGFTNPTPPKVLFFSNIPPDISDMALDTNGHIYITGYDVSSEPYISEYSTAVNTTSPMKTITGPATLLDNPVALAVDGAGNIYEEDAPTTAITAHPNTIYTFSSSASGNATPSGHFTTAANTFAPANFVGLVAY